MITIRVSGFLAKFRILIRHTGESGAVGQPLGRWSEDRSRNHVLWTPTFVGVTIPCKIWHLARRPLRGPGLSYRSLERGKKTGGEMAASYEFLQRASGGVLVKVRVQPRASKNEIAGIHQGRMKLRLTAPPVEGEANKGCVNYIAEVLGVPKSKVEIVDGFKSRQKTLLVSGASLDEVQSVLETVL